jgi:hypothetical protein
MYIGSIDTHLNLTMCTHWKCLPPLKVSFMHQQYVEQDLLPQLIATQEVIHKKEVEIGTKEPNNLTEITVNYIDHSA